MENNLLMTLGYFRDNLIYSKFEHIAKLLKVVKENPTGSYKEYKNILKISGGALYQQLKDAKIMNLYTNGYNKKLTELGERWLNESSMMNGKPTKETIKVACLNVPLFNRLYNENKELIITTKIIEYFKPFCDMQYNDESIISRATIRYLEGIHNIQSIRRSQLKLFKKQSQPYSSGAGGAGYGEGNTNKSILNNIDEYILLHKSMKELSEKHGLENLKKLIELL